MKVTGKKFGFIFQILKVKIKIGMQPSRVNTLLKHIIIIIIIRTSCILNKFDMRPDKKICDIYNKRIQMPTKL